MLLLQFGGLHLLEVFFDALLPLLHLAKIGDHQIEVYVLDVAHWINRPHMRNRGILECAYDVRQCVHISQVRCESGFLQRLLAQRCDVGKLYAGMNELLRVVKRSQSIQAIVRNLRDAKVCFARASTAMPDRLLGQHDEQRRFAYLRQADNSCFHRMKTSDPNRQQLGAHVGKCGPSTANCNCRCYEFATR